MRPAATWVILSALLLWKGSASAQTPPPPTPHTSVNSQAAEAAQRGEAAFRDRRYGDARLAYEEATRLEPTPNRWYMLGQACRGMSRYTQAIDAFEHFLTAPGADVDPARIPLLRAEIESMRRLVGRLSLTVTPATAAVSLDGRALALPIDQALVDPGPHVLEVTAEGHRPERREVNVTGGAALVLQFALTPVTTQGPRLIIESSEPGAQISVDGQNVGSGRADRTLSAGDHLVEINASGYETFRRPVHLGATGTTRVDATLRRRGLPGWVVPVAIAGSVVVVAGVVTGVVIATRDSGPELNPAWGTVTEAIRFP